MQPDDVQIIGTDLAIRWKDGGESFIPLETLRRACPCASCSGERDIFGNLARGPIRPLTADSMRLIRIIPVGSYALQPVWADGHNTGLYTFDQLKRMAPA